MNDNSNFKTTMKWISIDQLPSNINSDWIECFSRGGNAYIHADFLSGEKWFTGAIEFDAAGKFVSFSPSKRFTEFTHWRYWLHDIDSFVKWKRSGEIEL